MKYGYRLESHYLGQWVKVVEDSLQFCEGFIYARKGCGPHSAYRIVRSDGKVVMELKARDDVFIGMVAGFPTPEQYEQAAARALERAEAIRKSNFNRYRNRSE